MLEAEASEQNPRQAGLLADGVRVAILRPGAPEQPSRGQR